MSETAANVVAAVGGHWKMWESPAGPLLLVGGGWLAITPDCTPILPFIALSAAIASTPSGWISRMIGIAAGAVVLWIYNILRILGLGAVLAWNPQLFELAHVLFWQLMTLVIVLALFAGWLRGRDILASSWAGL